MPSTSPIVLVVDPQPASQAMFGHALLAMGFQSVLAESGEDACARIDDLRPDVVVTESTLPGMSGVEFVMRLRRQAGGSDIGTILLADPLDSLQWQRARAAGCDGIIVKPCRLDVLASHIRDLLRARQMSLAGPGVHDGSRC